MICVAVTIRLAPLLPTNVAIAQFPDVRKATEASIEIMNRGVGIRKFHHHHPQNNIQFDVMCDTI
jgi:hypothetical protein